MEYILRNTGIFNCEMFTELRFISEVGVSLPSSNAWPQRGASVVKLTKKSSEVD